MLIAARFTGSFSRLVTLNGRSMLAVTVAAVGLSGTSSAVLAQAFRIWHRRTSIILYPLRLT